MLDGPQQTAGLVEVAVVGPTVERLKTLLTSTTAATAVKDAVCTGRVPCHANQQTAIVAKVGGPPILGVGHEVVEVFLEGGVVEGLEGLGIVKVLAERIGGNAILAQNVELEIVGPPVGVSGAATSNVAVEGALVDATHPGELCQTSFVIVLEACSSGIVIGVGVGLIAGAGERGEVGGGVTKEKPRGQELDTI